MIVSTTITLIVVILYKVNSADRRETVLTSQRLRTAMAQHNSQIEEEYRCYLEFPKAAEHSGHIVDQVSTHIQSCIF